MKWAFKFGRMEHAFSRILFLLLLATTVAYQNDMELTGWLLYADIVCWLLYWGSHITEKALFPRNYR